ncbi:MAG: alpha-L-fucosidase [Leeuwenhoekiella sp.]
MKKNKLISSLFLFSILLIGLTGHAQQSIPSGDKLKSLQQDFVDLRFGMFIHYNIPTYMEDDWADPDASPQIFNPDDLDTDQWAEAAKSANMSYGALTTKHHSGFCIWDTKTTDYNVMNSPLKRDVVKEYVDSFRKNDLKVMLYYSILDTHHKIRPGHITPEKIEMIKAQLTELLTNYGKIDALIIDGWDAPWSRISYDDVPFEELYRLIKSIQPDCLVMDLNAAKYPAGALFYTDIKSYEQGAGQHIGKDSNKLPALSCLPIQQNWFWKPQFPDQAVKNPEELVNNNLIPFNNAYCNFILNVAPNRHGKIDNNALEALKKIGQIWHKNGQKTAKLPTFDAPIISSNIAKFKPSNSSWSNDMWIMDFANDDDFDTSWQSHRNIEKPWYEVDLGKEQPFNMITITESKANINKYKIEYFVNNNWVELLSGKKSDNVKIHRFPEVWGNKIRITITGYTETPSIAEVGVYNERN